MSYTIHYGTPKQKYRAEKRRFSITWIVVPVLVFALVVSVTAPQVSEALREMLFPWLQPEAEAAFYDFSSSVKEGTSFLDALAELYASFLRLANEKI